MENKYELGYGIIPENIDGFFDKVEVLLKMKNRGEIFSKRRKIMLNEKIDTHKFLVWFLENYPESEREMNMNPDNQFKLDN